MKLMFASDIHGSALYAKQLLARMEEEAPQRLVLLGDLLYHGPRNGLPDGYAPKEVAALLNAVRPRPVCVRGNCEAEVDQMVLEFPVLADYCLIPAGKRMLYVTHGHVWTEDRPPRLSPGDILLTGHTHIPKCADHGSYVYLNPGSVSIPKDGSWHGYMIWEETGFVWKDLDGVERLRWSPA